MTTVAGSNAPHVAEGWRLVACPLCGATESELIFETRNTLFGTDETACMRQCPCGMCMTNPQPKEHTLAKLYATTEYYTHSRGDTGKEKARSMLRRWQLGGALSSLRGMLERRTDLRRFQSRFAPELFSVGKGQSLLDFGCGSGHVSTMYAGLGMSVVGVEPDEQARVAAATRGVRVVASMEAIGEQKFERVIMTHVLEHVLDPVSVLKSIRERMKPDGLMLISVPNVEAFQAKVFGECWIGYDMPRHLWHFSAETLTRVGALAGLRMKGIKTVELSGFAQASLKNLPAERRAKVEKAKWSAREVEKIGAGAEIVGVFSVERRAPGAR